MTMDEFTEFKIIEQAKMEALEACMNALQKLRETVPVPDNEDEVVEWVIEKLNE